MLGLDHPIEEHNWTLPNMIYGVVVDNLVSEFDISKEEARKMTDEIIKSLSGYTPGDAGEDIRDAK